jgi:catalase
MKSPEGRLIGCLVADGSDATIVANLTKAAAKQGCKVKVIAPKIGGAKAKDGTVIPAYFQLAGGRPYFSTASSWLFPTRVLRLL